MLLPNHGANPRLLAQSLQAPFIENSIDFSVNVNPYPALPELKEVWESLYEETLFYPEPSAHSFTQRVAEKEGLEPEQVLAGNGAAELIFLIAQAYRGSKVLIMEPAFSEYREACEANDCEVEGLILEEEKGWQANLQKLKTKLYGKQLCFLCHPNNPTGSAWSLEGLEEVAAECERQQVTLVVDEAFVHFLEEPVSALPLLQAYQNVIILRSMTKMFHLPGLRLGYALSSAEQCKELKKRQPPWSVNGVAQKLGLICLEREEEFAADIARKTAAERERVFPLLHRLGFETSPSKVNFYLLRKREEKKRDQLALVRYLLSKGIIVRHTYNFAELEGRYIRLAIRTPEENDRLLAVLEGWKER